MPPKYTRKQFEERFWSRVDKHGPPPAICPERGPCWLWTASTNKDGYGVTAMMGQNIMAYRASWVIHHGPIPDGLHVLHHCDIKPCVNPNHLYLGTHTDNMLDMTSRDTYKHRDGEANPRSILTEADVLVIRSRYESGGVSQQELANEYGISRSTVCVVVNRETWKHI